MGEGISLKEFRQALDLIIEASVEENGGSRIMVEDEVNNVELLHNLMKKARNGSHSSDILVQCDGFIHEWESSGRISAAVQQLIALLNRPHVRSALVAAHDISNGRYSPELPPVPFEVDDDDGIAVKIVKLVKKANTSNGIGVTIKKDSKGRVVISRVLKDSIAEKSGCIQEGDRILEVNSLNVQKMDPTDIALLLTDMECGSVSLKMHPADPPTTMATLSNIHLRALSDYDSSSDRSHPCTESGVSFSRGDIIELLMCGDDYWWQGRRIGRGAFAGTNAIANGECRDSVGLFPSETLMLKRRSGGTIGKRRDMDGLGTIKSLSSKGSRDFDETLPYESVCRLSPTSFAHIRPILLIGAPSAGRNELKRRLMTLYPKRFSSTVPHTTRTQREKEANGVQYHFVSRSRMEEMISKGEMMEFGEFKGNLYGTALSAVHLAATKGMPLLTPHPLALKTLRSPSFIPFIIFIRPPSKKDFINSRSAASLSRGRPFSENEIDSIMEQSQAIEKAHAAYFDAEILNSDIECALSDLIRILDSVDSIPSWVPLSWATREDR
ncbi:hypothetical protein PENTCL1PPCAC_11210 [Pristionchus entomophagus]|uniref:Uncharacterized protein n=1 Tax=Pristionchus entomophagus TaxID=358040 RepID=A0AAV5T1U5_9BILA|nr:hypothetical protein PENTCL1PPCAC_11210 [Pristionchus entomophagus]